MKRIGNWLVASLFLALSACTSVNVVPIVSHREYAPEPHDRAVETYQDFSQIRRPHKKVAELRFKSPKKNTREAIDLVRESARQLGADAIVITTPTSQQNVNYLKATAVVYDNGLGTKAARQAKRPSRSLPKPVVDTH